jgi:tetrahydromethanopterin S-methyltransferase subunit B
MSNLPTVVRRVYNYFYKRRATGDSSLAPTPTEIKEYFHSQGFNTESITDEEFNQAINHFSKGELSLQLDSTALDVNQGEVNESDSPESSIVLTDQQLKDIVTTKAAEMSIQLSTSDVEYVASQIDSIDTTLDDVLTQTENLLCAYADYKKQEGIQKIDAMFERVYNHVQSNNEETSHHISSGLQKFGRDVEQSQQDFKSSVFNALERLKVSSISA